MTSYLLLKAGTRSRKAPLSQNEILLVVRKELEFRHSDQLQDMLFHYYNIYEPEINVVNKVFNVPDMRVDQADDYCNKSVPIYVCTSSLAASEPPVPFELCLYALQNWIYERWLKPRRSDIEWGQFIAKLTRLSCTGASGKWTGLGDQPGAFLDSVVRLHAAVCSKVQDARQHIIDGKPDPEGKGWHESIIICQSLPEIQRDQEFFLLQHLFQAVIILVDGHDYSLESSDVGDLPVHVIRTGVEDGLSAPVSLDSIREDVTISSKGSDGKVNAVRTTMKVAFAFVQELEQRELAAFGPRPDPVKAGKGMRAGYVWYGPQLENRIKFFGWQPDWEPFEYPSSRWIDPNAPGLVWYDNETRSDHFSITCERNERYKATKALEEWRAQNQQAGIE